jgi:hypothetical protein
MIRTSDRLHRERRSIFLGRGNRPPETMPRNLLSLIPPSIAHTCRMFSSGGNRQSTTAAPDSSTSPVCWSCSASAVSMGAGNPLPPPAAFCGMTPIERPTATGYYVIRGCEAPVRRSGRATLMPAADAPADAQRTTTPYRLRSGPAGRAASATRAGASDEPRGIATVIHAVPIRGEVGGRRLPRDVPGAPCSGARAIAEPPGQPVVGQCSPPRMTRRPRLAPPEGDRTASRYVWSGRRS